MTGFAGRRNIYTCQTCRRHIVTVDLIDGTSPFLLGCRATPGCTGKMQSSMYRVFDQEMRATHEWYRPTGDELAALTGWSADHVQQGGLMLREVEGEPSTFWALELAARVGDYCDALQALWDAGQIPDAVTTRTATGRTLDDSFDRLIEVAHRLIPPSPAPDAPMDETKALAIETRPPGKRAQRRAKARGPRS